MPHEAPSKIVPYGGQLKASMASGDYFAINLPDRKQTPNMTMWEMWDLLNCRVQTLSTHPAFDSRTVTEDLLSASFQAIDDAFVETKHRIVTYASGMFNRTFGRAWAKHYEQYPIRWTGNNRQGLTTIHAFIESIYSIPLLAGNDTDCGLVEPQAMALIRPLVMEKKRLIRTFLQLEVQGELEGDELTALFRNAELDPPLTMAVTDQADNPADKAAKDKIALEAKTQAGVSSPEDLAAALAGVNVFTWRFTPPFVARFSEWQQRQERIGHAQVPVEPVPFNPNGELGSAAATGASA